MSHKITISTTQTGFAVQFPFALKDNFRKCFPSAKWDSGNKKWLIGPRGGKRFEEWSRAQQQAVEMLAELEEFSLTQAELAEIDEQRREVKNNLQTLKERYGSLAETKICLEGKKEELKDLKKLQLDEEDKLAQLKNHNSKLLSAAIDLPAVLRAQVVMSQNHKHVGAAPRETFEEARKVISGAYKKLKSKGLLSRGIEKLADARFNRPDRDYAGNVTYLEILDVINIDIEEEDLNGQQELS